ncbi:MAG: hypothetical protein AAF401_14095 [Pseudomonadota bacterium]
MRTLKFVLVAILAIVIIILAVANGDWVAFKFWPDLTMYGVPASPVIELPLLVIGVLCGIVGFVFGALREYLREGRIRSTARKSQREAQALKAKVDELTGDQDDDIPALPAR